MKQNIKDAALDYMRGHERNFYAEDNNVELYIGPVAVGVDGIFAVNACDYHEAMRQVYKHENGIDGN